MNPFIKKLLYLTSILASIATPNCNATILFSNNADTIAMNQANAKLFISNPAKVVGWTNRSIVKAFGDNASSSWPEAYTSNAVIAQSGAGTTPARTMIVSANSNAINVTGGTLRASSNLLLYTARTYSSAIVSLNWRTDSTNLTMRTTSNAVNLFYSYLPVPTTDSIDGTQFMRYHTTHHVFHNGGSTIRGWVRFNNGFTIMPQASVLMDTLTTVSGGFDLRDTGTLMLNNDLYLAHNVTLTSGGYIEGTSGMGGQANTIFMGGDLTLASDNYAKVLHITGAWQTNANSGDLIIDGCGHTLNIGSQAQIFVDQNVTLTLRNMTIKTSPASFLKPAIQLASMGSKLALDNVMFDLGADFQFEQGQLFIHDEVAVTGTSAFIYTSPKPSYITSGATWSFETGTTFSIAPATYTDQPFTAGTATSNNFIVLADQSAALSLNNCSLKTTFTGARFSKGMVLFDNKVAIDTQAGSEITGLGTGVGIYDASTTVSSVALSPDGRYLAIGWINSGVNADLIVYRFNGTSAPTAVTGNYVVGGTAIPTVAWSPDGKFVAAGSNSSFVIFRFNGTSTLTQIINKSFGGLLVNSISWSPDGRYLAVGGNSFTTTPLIVYRFEGVSLTQVATANLSEAYGPSIQVNGVSWSADGKNLLVVGRQPGGNHNGNFAYSFDGQTLSTVVYNGGDGNSLCFTWSPDGRYAANGYVDSGGNGRVQIYTYNRTTWVGAGNVILGTMINAVAWSPNGKYLLVCGANGTAGIYQLYRIDTKNNQVDITPLSGNTFGSPAGVATTVAWSPDSKYVLIGGTNNDSGQQDLMAFPVTFAKTSASTQGFSNGLVFGDKGKGANFDANVQILGGAVVKVKGMVKDDSF